MGCVSSMAHQLLSGNRRWNEDWIVKFCRAMGLTVGEFLSGIDDVIGKDREWLLNRLFWKKRHKSMHIKLQDILDRFPDEAGRVQFTLESLEAGLEKRT